MLKRQFHYVLIAALFVILAVGATAHATQPTLQADADHCINCHTSEALLQALAVEEEAGEALSEGPG